MAAAPGGHSAKGSYNRTPLLDTRTLFRQSAWDDMGRMSHEALLSNAILYTYPGGEVDIICSAEKPFTPEGWEASEDYSHARKLPPERAKREKGAKADGEDALRSMRRARANLRRLALANHFKWFVTLTLDKEKIDRYDGEAITKRLNQWCSNMVKRHGLAYVLVPEQHKDGAWHFHGFFTDCVKAVDSGHKDKQGHPVYNLPQWGNGFSTAIELYGEYSGAVAYVCIYIGKQQGQRPLGRWYYSGGELSKPEKTYTLLDYKSLQDEYESGAFEVEIPGNKLLVIHTSVDKSKQEVEHENRVYAGTGSGTGAAGTDGNQPSCDAHGLGDRAPAGGYSVP